MSTNDKLDLAQDRSTSGFVSADTAKIDWTKFSPEQVDIKFFHCCLTAKIDMGKIDSNKICISQSNILN